MGTIEGCRCPVVWGSICPPPCPVHNPKLSLRDAVAPSSISLGRKS